MSDPHVMIMTQTLKAQFTDLLDGPHQPVSIDLEYPETGAGTILLGAIVQFRRHQGNTVPGGQQHFLGQEMETTLIGRYFQTQIFGQKGDQTGFVEVTGMTVRGFIVFKGTAGEPLSPQPEIAGLVEFIGGLRDPCAMQDFHIRKSENGQKAKPRILA